MPPARTTTQDPGTAAAPQDQGSGCLSGFILPPLAVIVISAALASFAWSSDALASSLAMPALLQSTQTSIPLYTDTPAPVPSSTPVPAGITETAVIPPVETPTTIAVAEARIVEPAEMAVEPAEVHAGISTAPAVSVFANSAGSISPVFTDEVQYWGEDIVQWSAAAQVDPNLAATVMQIESCGDPRATSSAGAMGLFQVMPFHFHATDSPYSPDTNAARGLDYLARSLQAAGGDARLALAGYHGGIGVIDRGEWTWSAQTNRYVQYGWPIYSDAQNGSSSSGAVEEWYSKYGASLCRQASERLGLP
jgi:soluble lytic murein transglycosylase-like protein